MVGKTDHEDSAGSSLFKTKSMVENLSTFSKGHGALDQAAQRNAR